MDELALVAVDHRHVVDELRVHDLRKRIAPCHADVAHHDPPIGEREGRFVRHIVGERVVCPRFKRRVEHIENQSPVLFQMIVDRRQTGELVVDGRRCRNGRNGMVTSGNRRPRPKRRMSPGISAIRV